MPEVGYVLPFGLPDSVYPCQLKIPDRSFIRLPFSQTLSSDELIPGTSATAGPRRPAFLPCLVLMIRLLELGNINCRSAICTKSLTGGHGYFMGGLADKKIKAGSD